MTDTTLTLLRTLDAAPATPVSAAEIDRREALLQRIVATPTLSPAPDLGTTTADRPSATRRRRTRRTWAAFGLGTAMLGAAAFGTVLAGPHLAGHLGGGTTEAASGPLSTTALASWTNTPTALTQGSTLATKAETWCTTNLGKANGGTGTATISDLDARGDVASLLYNRAGMLYYCVSAGDGTGLWEVVDQTASATTPVAADGILIDTAGSHGNGAAGLSYGVGFAGADVTSVVLHEPGLAPIHATLQNGHWTAWWPTPGDSAHGGPSGTITISTTGGASRTVQAASLYPQK